jgi:hypothetical protein
MSDDQIIRSSKHHEVTIPEGSNNASSQKSYVGVREPEVASDESQVGENAEIRHTVRVQEEGDADRRIALVQEADAGPRHVSLPSSDAAAGNRALLPDEGQASANRVALPGDAALSDTRVALPAQDSSTPNRAALPVTVALQSNRVSLPSDAREDNVVQIDTEDAIQDTHAQLPDMTHTSDATVAIDSDRITDPERVLVEGSMPERTHVDVPVAEPLAPQAEHEPVAEQHEASPVAASPVEEAPAVVAQAAVETAATEASVEVAQVTSHLSDKKAEEFRGRVVKLRDEVDQLNRRLDEIEKFEI